jgi:hypothetical protein
VNTQQWASASGRDAGGLARAARQASCAPVKVRQGSTRAAGVPATKAMRPSALACRALCSKTCSGVGCSRRSSCAASQAGSAVGGRKKSKQPRLSGTASESTPPGRSARAAPCRKPIGSGMCSMLWEERMAPMRLSRPRAATSSPSRCAGPTRSTSSISATRPGGMFGSAAARARSAAVSKTSRTRVFQPARFGASGLNQGPISMIGASRGVNSSSRRWRSMGGTRADRPGRESAGGPGAIAAGCGAEGRCLSS